MKTGNSLRSAVPNNVTPLGRLAQVTDPKSPTQLELWSNSNLASARGQDAVARARVDFSAELAGARFNELDLTVSPHEEAIWCYMRPNGPPSFTPTLLNELISMRRLLQRLFAGLRPGEVAPVKYFVGGSRIPGVYNLGGDLNFSSRASARAISTRCAAMRTTVSMSPIT
jgi:hypothetical protein